MYFDNSFDSIFNIKVIGKSLSMSEDKILEAYSKLMSKKLIKVKRKKMMKEKLLKELV